MDLSPITPASADDGLEITQPLCAVFRRSLKAGGLKYTPERAQILDAIIQLDAVGNGVFEAEELIERLRRVDFRVSKATVYRTIKLLAEAGIIQQVLFDADQSHYQLAYGKRSVGLLVRLDTREIIPIDLPELSALRDRVCHERGLEPQGHRLVIYANAGSPASAASIR